MRCCQACSLPLADSVDCCAFCGRPVDASKLFEMRPAGRGFAWREPAAPTPTAHARLENGLWAISTPTCTNGPLTFIEGGTLGTYAVIDEALRPWATLALHPPGSPHRPGDGSLAGRLTTASGRAFFVRTDGPTGLHVVDADGDVAAIASCAPGLPLAGFDVLVLPGQPYVQPVAYFAALLGLALVRLPQPRCDLSGLNCLCLDVFGAPKHEAF